MADPIVLYTSNFCGQAKTVDAWLTKQAIPVEVRNISEDLTFRDEVETINNGFASVPTLVFADGSTLTEPSMKQLRDKLGIEPEGIVERVRDWFNL